jgi:hypothetical protein
VAAAPRASLVEQALIGALAKRYSADPTADRAPLDAAYASAMREVWTTYPRDADVGTLCAEALMDLHPWDLWTHEGKPKEYTPEIVETLERVLGDGAGAARANHFYIHTVEASARDPSAGRLGRPPAPARAGRRAPRAHAGAHLHPRRALRGRVEGERGRDEGRPRLPRAVARTGVLPDLHGAQPTVPRVHRDDGGTVRRGARGRADDARGDAGGVR